MTCTVEAQCSTTLPTWPRLWQSLLWSSWHFLYGLYPVEIPAAWLRPNFFVLLTRPLTLWGNWLDTKFCFLSFVTPFSRYVRPSPAPAIWELVLHISLSKLLAFSPEYILPTALLFSPILDNYSPDSVTLTYLNYMSLPTLTNTHSKWKWQVVLLFSALPLLLDARWTL